MDLKDRCLHYLWCKFLCPIFIKIILWFYFFVILQQKEKKKKIALSTKVFYKSYRSRRKKKQIIVAKKQIAFPVRFDKVYMYPMTILTDICYDKTIDSFIIFSLESGYFSYREMRAFLIAFRRALKKYIRFFRMRRRFFFLSTLTKKTKGARMGKGRGHNFIYLYPIFIGQPLFYIICLKEKSAFIYQYFFSFKHKLSLNVSLLMGCLLINIDHIKCLYYMFMLYNSFRLIILSTDYILLHFFHHVVLMINIENYLIFLISGLYNYNKVMVSIA